MTEQFYRDIAAMVHPPACPQPQISDLPSWVIDHLQPRSGENILAIGNRDGRLTLKLARSVGDRGYVLAVDHSYRVLNALSQHSQEQGLQQRIRFLYLNLDDLDGHLRTDDFDRVLCSGALVRSRQPQVVFHTIFQALRPGGTCFFCGPARKDLAELGALCATCSQQTALPGEKELLFIERIGLPQARELFASVEILTFERTLAFDSPETLLACWKESPFYDEGRTPEILVAARRYFQSHALFATTRCFMGIRARK
jgi:ubiquinone/menaquinone biosynthesis C-methylase UbiE